MKVTNVCIHISLPACVVFLLFLLSFNLSSQITTKDKLVIGVLKEFHPHYTLDEAGEPTGFAIDTISHLLDRSHYSYRFEIYETWQELFTAQEKGEIDLIPNMGITEKRKEIFSFSEPVETFPVSIFTRSSQLPLPDLNSLEGKTIAVIHLNVGETLVKEVKSANVITYEHIQDGLFSLLSGQVDAFIYPEPILFNIAHQIGVEKKIKVDGKPVLEILRGISVLKGNEDLLEILNPLIKKYIMTDDYKEVYAKWFGRPIPFWTAGKILLVATILLFIFIFFMILWKYYSTEKLVVLRTKQLAFQAQLMKQVEDGVIALNSAGEIVSWNAGATRLLQYEEQEMTGKPFKRLVQTEQAESIFPKWLKKSGDKSNGERTEIIFIRKDLSQFEGQLSLSSLVNEENELMGSICLIQDISERKEMEARREKLIDELQNALTQIKTLKGLIPICASCKKIRDDQGYWSQVESYISRHSEATFSHGICPDCAQKLYGDIIIEEEKKH